MDISVAEGAGEGSGRAPPVGKISGRSVRVVRRETTPIVRIDYYCRITVVMNLTRSAPTIVTAARCAFSVGASVCLVCITMWRLTASNGQKNVICCGCDVYLDGMENGKLEEPRRRRSTMYWCCHCRLLVSFCCVVVLYPFPVFFSSSQIFLVSSSLLLTPYTHTRTT